jgi:hypothetical protein
LVKAKAEVRINVLPEVIREVNLEGIAISALWISRQYPEAYFGEIDDKKVVFTAGWRVDSKILDNNTHLISRTAQDVFFTKVEAYKRFIVHQESEGKVEYRDDVKDIPSTAIVIPVRKILSILEEKTLEAIKSKMQSSFEKH